MYSKVKKRCEFNGTDEPAVDSRPEGLTCSSDSTDRQRLVLFSCVPEMREADHTYMMATVKVLDSDRYRSLQADLPCLDVSC